VVWDGRAARRGARPPRSSVVAPPRPPLALGVSPDGRKFTGVVQVLMRTHHKLSTRPLLRSVPGFGAELALLGAVDHAERSDGDDGDRDRRQPGDGAARAG